MAQNIPFYGAGGAAAGPIVQHQQSAQGYRTNETGQSAAFATQQPHASWPQNVQVDGSDLAALAGVSPEQLAVIARLFQIGALPLQPGSSHSQPIPFASAGSATKADFTHPAAADGTPVVEDVDMDKEDGEIDDFDNGDPKQEPGSLRPPPAGPRSRGKSPHRFAANAEAYGSQPFAARSPAPPPELSTHQTKVDGHQARTGTALMEHIPEATSNSYLNGAARFQSQSDIGSAAEVFVMELHQAGYAFDQLASEVSNVQALERMYQRLGLPSSEAPSTSTLLVSPPPEPLPMAERKYSTNKRPAVKQTAPKDRTEYLAKLQAAKKKKSEPVDSSDKPVTAPHSNATLSPVTTLPPPKADQPISRPTPVGRANTELIRQRLEALKAEQAAKQNAVQNMSKQTTPTSSRPEAPFHFSERGSQGQIDLSRDASQSPWVGPTEVQSSTAQTTSGHASEVFKAAIANANSGLPGLFLPQVPANAPNMNAVQASVTAPGHVASPKPQLPHSTQSGNSTPPFNALAGSITHGIPNRALSRKRGVASDFYDDTQSSSGSGIIKRPFGQSRHESASDSLIITVSDDEDDVDNSDDDDDDDDEGDEMDIDDSSDEDSSRDTMQVSTYDNMLGSSASQPSLPQSSLHSAPGTPGRLSASDLQRTEQELVNLKKALAEAERRKAASKIQFKNSTSAQQPFTATTQMPVDLTQTLAQSTPAAPDVPHHDPEAVDSPVIASTLMADQTKPISTRAVQDKGVLTREAEKLRLRQRLQELQQARQLNSSPSVKLSNVPVSVQIKGSEPESASVFTEAVNRNTQLAPDGITAGPNISAIDHFIEVPTQQSPVVTSPENDSAQAVSTYELSTSNESQSQNEATILAAGPQRLEVDVDSVSNIKGQSVSSEMDQTSIEEASESKFATSQGYVKTQDSEFTTKDESVSESSGEDEDDLDDVYDQVNVITMSARSLTSAGVDDKPVPQDSDEEMGTSDNSSVQDVDDDEDLYEPTSAAMPPKPQVMPPTGASYQDVHHTDDYLALHDQSAASQMPEHHTHALISQAEEPARPVTHFKAYESPLTMFKDYRYHAEFPSRVSGGFKSLTYSNKIDADATLCPFEAVGDNDLLRAMGTEHTPAKTPEQDKQWREGLSAIIRQLRSTNNGKDAQEIAQRIADFRRDFLNDPTQVLHLG